MAGLEGSGQWHQAQWQADNPRVLQGQHWAPSCAPASLMVWRVGCAFSRFADDAEMGGAPEVCVAIQRATDKLEKWAGSSLLQGPASEEQPLGLTDWGAAWQKRLWESWSLGNCFILSFAFLMSKVNCETCLGTAEQCTCHRFFAPLQHFQAQETFASMTGQL